jgi:hypothetical protein
MLCGLKFGGRHPGVQNHAVNERPRIERERDDPRMGVPVVRIVKSAARGRALCRLSRLQAGVGLLRFLLRSERAAGVAALLGMRLGRVHCSAPPGRIWRGFRRLS